MRLCEVVIYVLLLESFLQLFIGFLAFNEGHAPIRRLCGNMATHPGLLNRANVHQRGQHAGEEILDLIVIRVFIPQHGVTDQ